MLLPPLSKESRSMMSKDVKELLRALNAHSVKYLVIGGYAYGVHLEPRATKDMDLFIGTDEENSNAIFRALAEFGAPLAGMSPKDFTDGTAFQLGQPPERVDIMQRIDGITFDEAWEHRIEGNIDGDVPTAVISKEDFIRNKLASGREQDLLDVKTIRAAEGKI
jgi:predicted nucleotidyltransferase